MSAVRMNGSKPGVVAPAFESAPPIRANVAVVRDRSVMPLNHSARLTRVSMRGASLSRLYARGSLECTVAGKRWRFRWIYLEGPISGLELRLRIGGTEVLMGIEDLGPLGAAGDVTHPELPDALRAAYLNALGGPVWQEIEATLGRAIEVIAVRMNCTMGLTSECAGFEIGVAPQGPATRGFVGPVDSDLQRLLCEVSDRKAARPSLPMHLPLEWAAVVGTTQLAASELQTIEIHDIVLIDDAVFSADALDCQLVVGVDRHRAGRAVLRLGELRMIQLTSPGAAFMTSPEPQPARARDSGFDDVPVVLRFELAQWQAPLSEVAQLASGTVIDLGRRIDGQSIAVWIGQRCIGRGQLVALGERLGVRVLSLAAGLERSDAPVASDHDTGASAVPSG